jgi:hypothetical protein
VRDAARVLGFTVDQANALSLLSDRFSAKATAEAMSGTRDERRATREEDDETSAVKRASELAESGSMKRESAHGPAGSHLVAGTESTTRTRVVDAAARRERLWVGIGLSVLGNRREAGGDPDASGAGCGKR